MQKITPNLWFAGDAEDAVDRYTSIFDDATIGPVSRYDEASAEVSGQPVGSAMTVAFELEGQSFVALNGGPQFSFTPAISFVVNCPTAEEVDELWAELSAGGMAHMPLDSYPFSDRYGWTDDEFGVSWQLIHADDIQERQIVPSLMFVGERRGQAEEAIDFYTSVFEDSAVGDIARYGPGQEPDEEGTVMFADFTLSGQRFAAMDSAREHGFDFTEAVSFIVNCADQAAVDYYWEELTADGGEEGQCAWLTDKYGVSWQIVPSVLSELLGDEDAEKAGRVTEAMLRMQKIDIDALEEAYAGKSRETRTPTKEASTTVSRIIDAPRVEVYRAFLDPAAVATWLPPEGMTGHVHHFDPHEGGQFRMSLTYQDTAISPGGAGGKTTEDTDTHQGRFVELAPHEKIVEVVEFESDDPAFVGEMRITVTLADVKDGTDVTYRCTNIPKGIRPEDNEAGCRSSLEKLAELLTEGETEY